MEPTIARAILEKCRTIDPWKNVNIDLTSINELDQKAMAHAIRALIPVMMDEAQKAGNHEFTIRYQAKHHRLGRLVVECNMVYHEAKDVMDPKVTPSVMLKKCLKNHEKDKCNYPNSKTCSVGVTGVVFNEDLTEFVSLQEIEGNYTGVKAVTGTVDHEIKPNETPLSVFVREVKEETNVDVNPSEAKAAGTIWTPCFRGKVADVNFIFAARVMKADQKLVAQASEVRNVKWMNVEEFLAMQLKVKHNKPLIVKEAVWKALCAMRNPQAPNAEKFAWGSGTDNEVYSSYPKKSML